MKSKIFTAPEQIIKSGYKSIFIAGTIDMGSSLNHQDHIINRLSDFSVDVYNPRRKNWDASWKQEISNPQFNEQVNWELDALDNSDIIIMNFLAESKSPISLLELGIYAKSKKIYVCCPKEFYRSGNVHIVCKRYNIPLFENIDSLVDFVITKI